MIRDDIELIISDPQGFANSLKKVYTKYLAEEEKING